MSNATTTVSSVCAYLGLLLALCLAGNAARAETTPYAVGSATVFLHDADRPFDAVAGIDDGIRTLITEVWYPADRSALGPGQAAATYGDYVFGDRAVHHRMMTQTTFFHLTPDTVRPGVTPEQIEGAIDELFARPRQSYPGVPLAAGGGWPVIIMSHGDAGSRYNMESAVQYLAGHGYIVVAPDHTGNSPYAQVGRDPLLARAPLSEREEAHKALIARVTDEHGTYGDAESHGQSYAPSLSDEDPVTALRQLDAALVERVEDLRTALRWLEHRNAEGPWRDRLALDSVGIMGRSFGGSTVLAGLSLEPRFAAGFAVVPPDLPDMRPMLPPEARVTGRPSVLLPPGEAYPLKELRKPTLLLNGAEDDLIIGLSSNRATSPEAPEPTASNPHPGLKSAFKASEGPALWALLADTNHGSLATAGPSWWPSLKPREFPRVFNPEERYSLLEPAVAHAIQSELALAFFDLFLRKKPEAAELLEQNPWASSGLALESRKLPASD